MRSGVLILTLLVALPLAAPSPSSAQDPAEGQDAAETGDDEDPPQFTEEISVTVTARKREEDLQSVPFSIVAPTQRALRSRGARSLEDVSANVAGFSVQNLGPGQSQIAMRRGVRGPGRARPAGRQGAGRRLPGRVRDLALALHAGHRPVRHVPHRGAARPAGDLVRVRLAVGNGALHHEPAGARRQRGNGGARLRIARRGRARPRRQVRGQHPARPGGGGARHRLEHRDRRLHGCRAAGPERPRERQRGPAQRRAGGAAPPAERAVRGHAAGHLPGRVDAGLEPHRRVQRSGQPVHDHAARGHARRAAALHADRRAVHGRVPAGRHHAGVRLRRRRADGHHLVHQPRTSRWCGTRRPWAPASPSARSARRRPATRSTSRWSTRPSRRA